MITIPETLALGIKHHQAGELFEAEQIYRQILASHPNHGDTLHYLGLLALQAGHQEAAVGFLARSIAIDPSKAFWHYNLGQALQSLGRLDEAVASYHRALQINPLDAEAYHNLGRIFHAQGNKDRAVEYFLQSLSINPQSEEAQINLGNTFQSMGKFEEAIARYQRVLAMHPEFAEVHCNLGNAFDAQGKHHEAVACYQKALQLKPLYTEAHYNLGNALRSQGNLDGAIASYRRVLEIKPNDIPTLQNLGSILHAEGKLNEAAECFEQALRSEPQQSELHHSLGIVKQTQGRLDEAAECFRQAIRLNPRDPVAQNDLGAVLLSYGKLVEAEVAYRRAIELDPSNADSHNNLGVTLDLQGKLNAAMECFRRALQLAPGKVEAHFNLGKILQEQKKFDDAAACFHRALELAPEFSEARCYLVHQLQQLCSWNDLNILAQKVIEDVEHTDVERPEHSIPPFAFLALAKPTTAEQQFRCAQQWVRHRLAPNIKLSRTMGFQHARVRSDKIRIGYLSSDFRSHPVGMAIVELLESHERSQFEVIGYSLGPNDVSSMRQRIINAFDRFVDISSETYVRSAQRIHSDRIDILIDLMGYTGRAQTTIMTLRPAPIQVLYLGYPGTMGSPFIDYLIADDFVVPRQHESFYMEKIVRLPTSFFPGDSQRKITQNQISRSDCGLPDKGFVFCCFNNSYKITPTQFAVWMRLLRTVPQSVIWFSVKHQVVIQSLREAATALGVDAARLVFAPKLPSLSDHLARYRIADLFLDTFPFNAHSTASDALWGGCPVLTLAGDTFASRVAGSLLHAVGLPELVTTSLVEYEQKALYFASNPVQVAELRARLQSNLSSCGLFDGRLRASELECAYKTMHQLFLAGKPPESIQVANANRVLH